MKVYFNILNRCIPNHAHGHSAQPCQTMHGHCWAMSIHAWPLPVMSNHAWPLPGHVKSWWLYIYHWSSWHQDSELHTLQGDVNTWPLSVAWSSCHLACSRYSHKGNKNFRYVGCLNGFFLLTFIEIINNVRILNIILICTSCKKVGNKSNDIIF